MTDPFDLPPDVLGRIPLFAELSKVLAWRGGPVNWDLGRQVAVSLAARGGVRAVDPAESEEIAQYVRNAELWLGELTQMPAPTRLVPVRAAGRVEWAEHGSRAFPDLVDPIAGRASRALGEQVGDLLPEEAGAMERQIAQALGQLTPLFMGIQAGMIIGTLAREVTGTHELVLPTSDDALLVVLENTDEAARDYELDVRQARQWVALQAAAHRTVFDGFPWVRTHFFALYHNYVASLELDLSSGMERLQSLDFSDPSRIEEALGDEALFTPQLSAAAVEAGARIMAFLAVVNAYVAAAVEATATRVGQPRIGEALARRNAEGGRGTQMFARLIGLPEPQNRRQAAEFVRVVVQRAGWGVLVQALDEPGAFPSADELTDPERWLERIGR